MEEFPSNAQQNNETGLVEGSRDSSNIEDISDNISLESTKQYILPLVTNEFQTSENNESSEYQDSTLLQQDSKNSESCNNLDDSIIDDVLLQTSNQCTSISINEKLNTEETSKDLIEKNKSVVDLLILLIKKLTLLKCQDEYLEDTLPNYVAKTNGYIILFIALIYIIDVGSDIFLGTMYFRSGENIFAAMTLFYVVVPSLISNIGNPASTW